MTPGARELLSYLSRARGRGRSRRAARRETARPTLELLGIGADRPVVWPAFSSSRRTRARLGASSSK
jgi:hypothetical protein